MITIACTLIGACLVVAGLSLIWIPLGFIGGGVALVAAGLFVDFDELTA